MRNTTETSCSDCGAVQRHSRVSELSLLLEGRATSNPSPSVQPIMAQPTYDPPKENGTNFRSFIVFGNMVVALAVLLILGTVSLFIGILASAM